MRRTNQRAPERGADLTPRKTGAHRPAGRARSRSRRRPSRAGPVPGERVRDRVPSAAEVPLMEPRCSDDDDTRQVPKWRVAVAQTASEPRRIASVAIRVAVPIVGRRCAVGWIRILHRRLRGGARVDDRRRRLPLRELDLQLELPQPIVERLQIGLRRGAYRERHRDQRLRRLAHDARDLHAVGRRQIADVDPAICVGPRIDIGTRGRDAQREADQRRENYRKKTCSRDALLERPAFDSRPSLVRRVRRLSPRRQRSNVLPRSPWTVPKPAGLESARAQKKAAARGRPPCPSRQTGEESVLVDFPAFAHGLIARPPACAVVAESTSDDVNDGAMIVCLPALQRSAQGPFPRRRIPTNVGAFAAAWGRPVRHASEAGADQ